jgi:hypothetical protein
VDIEGEGNPIHPNGSPVPQVAVLDDART